MLRKLSLPAAFGVILLILTFPLPVLAQADALGFPWWQLVTSVFGFLVPIGVILVEIAALPPEKAPRASLMALLAAGLAALAYWAIGFALQFGGIGLLSDVSSLRDLSWEWSLLDVTWGPGWGMAGLRGFFLTQGAATPEGLLLFLSHLPWVMTASILPALALYNRERSGLGHLLAAVMGGLLYPLFGNWVWGGGWLAHLGQTRALGHGFVDFGGSAAPFLLASATSLACLVLLRSQRPERAEDSEMPSPQLPLLAATGLFLAFAGLSGWLLVSPQAILVEDALPRALVNAILAAMGGGLVAGFYTWFVARRADFFMATRGALSGLVASLAGAPFIPLWGGWVVGGVAGLLLPLSLYLIDRVLKLADDGAIFATFGVGGLIGVIAPALLADGLYGVGWNGVGSVQGLGADGLGITGLLARVGGPGQLYAQLAGLAAALVWGFALPWALGRIAQGARSSLGKPPAPKESLPGNAGS